MKERNKRIVMASRYGRLDGSRAEINGYEVSMNIHANEYADAEERAAYCSGFLMSIGRRVNPCVAVFA